MQPPGASRTPAVIEPAPPLRAVLDLPLRFAISTSHTERISALADAAAKASEATQWLEVYGVAIETIESLLKETDQRLDEMQKQALHAEDPGEVRQRIALGPRREAEKGRAEAKAAIQRAVKEWVDRGRRQLDHVSEQCMATAKDAPITETQVAHGMEFRIDGAWWTQFGGYVARCCDEWTRNVTTGSETALAAAARTGGAAAARHAGGKALPTPASQAAPANEVRLSSDTPSKDVEIPTTAAALMASVRSNIMAVGVFATIVAVLVALAGKLGGDSGTSSNTMLVRGALLLAVLPFSIIFGIKGAKKQRVVLHQKTAAAYKQSLTAFFKQELDKALERHRKTLERWTTSRADAWLAGVDEWWEGSVEAALVGYEANATAALRDMKLQQAKLNEEIAALRTFRTQLAQNLLFDLRKRQRELREKATASI